MGGQTSGETMAWDRLSRIGAGLNAEQFHAETVNGSDPLAVADAVSRKREILQEGNGPALLDIECYRFSGHSTTDTNAYRSREEIRAWKLYDPIESFQRKIISEGLLTETGVTELIASVGNQIEAITRVVVDRKLVPAIDIKTNPTIIGDMTFNEESIELTLLADDLLMDPAGSKHQQSIKKKARFGFGKDGSQLSGMRAVTLRDSLSESILHHLTHDKSLIAYGEECRDWGGAFGVYRGFADVIPNHRLFNAPISEAAIVSTGIGYALAGLSTGSNEGIQSSVIYITIYILMNLGLFSCLLMMKRNNNYYENIEDLSGLSKNHPLLSLSLLVILFSLAGIPPLAGFFAKFYIFKSVIEQSMYFLAIVGLLSTVVAAFYYLRIIKIMYFDKEKEKYDTDHSLWLKFSLTASTLLILIYFIFPSQLIEVVSRINII